MYDVIIVGAGPAGLSAALLLGRCCRRVLLCDSGTPRNARAPGVHGFLSRDGIPPLELRALGRRQLEPYGVEYRESRVADACLDREGFEVRFDDGCRERARKLLLATGVRDVVPEVEGFDACYGRSVFHCPYCDAWEVRGRRLGLYARGRSGVGMAVALRDWSDDVVLLTDGPSRLTREDRVRLERHRVEVRAERVVRLEHEDGLVKQVVFEGGRPPSPCGALFFKTGQVPQSELARKLGCQFTAKGAVKTGRLEETVVPGLYVAGDASRDVQLAIVAAAEGAKAAFAINTALQKERFEKLSTPSAPAPSPR